MGPRKLANMAHLAKVTILTKFLVSSCISGHVSISRPKYFTLLPCSMVLQIIAANDYVCHKTLFHLFAL